MSFKIGKIEPLQHFKFYFSYLKWKMFIGLLLSIFVGVLDGVGLAFFLPLISMTDINAENESKSGEMDFFKEWLESLNIPPTLEVMLLIILIVFIVKGIIKWIEGMYMVNTQRDFVVQIKKQCTGLFKDFKYLAFTKADSGRIQNTFTGGVAKVASGYRTYFTAMQNGDMVLVYVAMASIANSQN